MTYPQPEVIRTLNEQYVPCKLESAKHPEIARRLNVRWLPAIAVIDPADERPASLSFGFLPPQDLFQELAFGSAVTAMAQKRYDDAHALFQKVAEDPAADRAPEAYYWWGVSRYRQSKDFKASVTPTWGKIVERWPGSQWARKVGFGLR